MAERKEWDVLDEVVGQTPFLTARPPEEERRQPVRPMIADSDKRFRILELKESRQ